MAKHVLPSSPSVVVCYYILLEALHRVDQWEYGIAALIWFDSKKVQILLSTLLVRQSFRLKSSLESMCMWDP